MVDVDRFHYIMSGVGYPKLLMNSSYTEENTEFLRNLFKKVKAKGYSLGMLYNAFTEKSGGDVLNKYLRDVICDIHADSGGLQIITRGSKMDSGIKRKIYESQAKNSTIAMSFDEIPLYTPTASSKIGSTGDRFFDKDIFVKCAKDSAANLKEQIDAFREFGTVSKPLMIVQGNDVDTFLQWADIILNELPPDYHDYLGGISLGSTSLGNGEYESFVRTFASFQILRKYNLKNKQIHLLGVGSMRRLVPNLVCFRDGRNSDVTLSFDSTSHTSGIAKGCFYVADGPDQNQFSFGRHYDQVAYEKIFNKIKEIDQLDGVHSPKHLHNVINSSNEKHIAAGKDKNEIVRVWAAFAVTSSLALLEATKTFLSAPRLEDVVDMKKFSMYRSFQDVDTKTDFDEWSNIFKSSMKSVAVKEKQVDISSFF
jgi:hypothetical protein